MALKFRHLPVPQAKGALRHRVVNSTDLTSSQSSYERRDAIGQCGHDTSVTASLHSRQAVASKLHFRQSDDSIFACGQVHMSKNPSILQYSRQSSCFLSRQTFA